MTRPSLPSQIEEAARWATSFRLDQAPRDVIELSTWQIANIVTAILAGSCAEAGEKLWRAVQRTLSSGPCTLLPHGVRASLWDALYLHAAYANALELDDFHYRGHLGPAVVVVPLALAEAHGYDGRAVLRAQVVANELGGRLGWAITAEIRHGHQRSYLLRFAAAASAGVLLGLDDREMAGALAIALTQPELPLHPGEFSPDTKVLSAASSVVEGARAAYLAAEDFSAALDILEHRAGFYRQFTMHREVPSPFVQLGEAWCTHALSFKRYSACGYAAGVVDAAREIRANPAFDPTAVERVHIGTSLPALTMERLAEPHEPNLLTPVNVQFSIARSVAAALWLGDLRGYHFRPGAFAELLPPVRQLAPLAVLAHDWTYTIQQLRGIDAGLRDKGGRRSADILQFYRTSGAFRRMFGSARAIGPSDIRRLLALPAEDRRYFLGRWGRSIRSHLRRPFAAEDGDDGPLGDLRRLSWRMGGRVTVTMKTGYRFSAERVIPTGMAGDPNRGRVVREKLVAECGGILGRSRCDELWNSITSLGTASSVAGVITLASHGDGGNGQ